MEINPSIFKAYDIRGTYPDQLDEKTAYSLGRAFASWTVAKHGAASRLAIGSDMRLSSPALKESLIQGIRDSGVAVYDVGLVSTPTFYFTVSYFSFEGGIQVSASHNPKEWNGFKVVGKAASPISKNTGLIELMETIQQGIFLPIKEQKGSYLAQGGMTEEEAKQILLLEDASGIKPFKIVIDGSNGMGSLDMQALFASLSCEIIPMNFELDGTFPAHEADPMKAENIKDLCARVLAEKADLGIAHDGDGDRIFFVDEKGEVLPQGILRGLMAQIELQEHPGATVAYDIRPGRITKDMIEQYGGKAVVTPVGHSLIKEIMIKEGAIFGGESSGHYFYKLPWGTYEAPMLLVLKLLKYLSTENKTLSEVAAPLKKYAHSGEINIRVSSAKEVQERIEKIKQIFADGKQILVDGITVEYPDYWFNLRASNTEPLIRFALEAVSEDVMRRQRDIILEILK